MKWLDYREQLGIGFDDSQKANMFKNKITALLTTVSSHLTKHDFTPYYVTVGEAPPCLLHRYYQRGGDRQVYQKR